MDNTKEAARQVYSAAGITAKDIQVREYMHRFLFLFFNFEFFSGC